MHLRIFYCLLLTGCTQLLSAQITQKDTAPEPTTFIRWNALGLADMVDMNLSVGAERRLKHNWSVAADAAWILRSKYYQKAYETNGFMVRSALRRYRQQQRQFVELELHYKSTNHYIEDWLGRDCVAGISTYEEYTRFKIVKQTMGVHLKVGEQYQLGRTSRWWLEGYLGAGIHIVKEKLSNQPNSCYTSNAIINRKNPQSWTALPALPMGLRLLYRIP